MSAKITKATLKSFVRKNAERLFIKNLSDFDAMVDGIRECDHKGFRRAEPTSKNSEHTLGVSGVWLVGQSRDYFKEYERDGFQGIEVYNSCGNFVLAVRAATL